MLRLALPALIALSCTTALAAEGARAVAPERARPSRPDRDGRWERLPAA